MAEAFRKEWLPAWLFVLYFIYPIPHTIALRNVLLVAGLAACLWTIRRDRSSLDAWPALGEFQASGWILALLTGWLLFQSAFISPYPNLALDMLRGDWFNELLVAITAACALFAYRRKEVYRPLVAIIFALFSHIVLLLTYQGWQWAHTGAFPFGATPFAQKDYHSMLATTLIGLLLADLAAQLTSRKNIVIRVLLPLPVVLTMLSLDLIATATLLARNAVIVSILMLAASVGIIAVVGSSHLGKRTLRLGVVAALLVSSAIVGTALRSDSRWQGFSEAAAVAFDTQNNMAWLDREKYPLPLMRNGQPVEESAYSRLAWAKVALEQIQRYPLGLGYGHKAFGWAVNSSYNVKTGHESSHSGLLDFTLANGIPGLLLWLALSATLIRSGWRAFRDRHSSIGLMLAFTVIAYLVRCLVDGHLSGFRLEMYALLVGSLVMAQATEKQPCN